MSQMGKYTALGGSINTLSGNFGGPIAPTGDNIFIIGAAPIEVVGNPLTSTLTIQSDGGIALTYTTNGGIASPVLGNLNVLGGANIATNATGVDTININLSGTTDHAIQVGNATGSLTSLGVGTTGQVLNANTGANPAFANLGVNSGLTNHGLVLAQGNNAFIATGVGGNGQLLIGSVGAAPSWASLTSANSTITFTPGPNSLNLATGSSVARSFVANDTNSAVPLAGVLNIVGGANINTTAAGNTITINAFGGMTNGQIIIGSTGVAPVVGSLTSVGGSITITPGAGTLNIEAGAAVASSYLTDDTNSAVPALGVLTVAGGTNIGSTSAGSTVTLNLDTALTAITSLTNTNTAFTLNTGTGTIGLSTDAAATTVNIANGAGVKTVTLGSNNTTSQLVVQSGTNGININSNDGGLVINSGTGTLAISNDASATTLNIGIGAAAKAVTIGSTNTTSSLDLETGTGDFSLSSATGNLVDVTNAGVVTLYNDLDVTEGGTGVSTLTSHGILLGNGASDIQALAEANNGQIPIGSTGANPVLATLTAGAGISITNAAGSVTIATTGSGMGWEEVTDAAKNMAADVAYGANRGGGVVFTLPAAVGAGSRVEVVGMAGLWQIAQNAGQTVYIGNTNTTAGVGGSLTATDAGDCVELICITTDTAFRVFSMMGNVTVV